MKSDIRSFRLKLSVLFNLILKFLNITINVLLLPALLNVLGKDKFGFWVTIFSFIGWLNIFDFGLGEGLKLKLTKAFSLKRTGEINKLITSTYFFTVLVVLILILIFVSVNFFVDWSFILDANKYIEEINKSICLLIFFILLLLIVKLIGTIYAAFQWPFIDNVIKTVGQLLFLIGVLVLNFKDIKADLTWVAVLSLAPTFLIYSFFNLYFFKYKASFLFPRVKNICKQTLKDVTKPGLSFFIIQLGCIVLYSTDNVIVLKLFSSNQVTDYSIYYKYYSFPFMFYGLFIASHWNAFIDAIAKNDYNWIEKKIVFFKKMFFLLVFVYVIIYSFEEQLIYFWVGKENINLDFNMSLNMIGFFLISSYTTIYIYVINAYGKLYIQLLGYVLITIINIPLSVYLVNYFNFGASGVILASSLCLLILAILIPIQYRKIVTSRLYGIWNK